MPSVSIANVQRPSWVPAISAGKSAALDWLGAWGSSSRLTPVSGGRVPMDPLASLLEGVTLTRLDDDRFEGRAIERTRPRMFGGDLLAQSLMAAGMTTKDRRCHRLHVSFLAPGDPTSPIQYRVRRLRDGRRFAQRQLSAWQGDREILIATAWFTAAPSPSHVHQHEAMPDVPGPEGLSSELDQRKAEVDRLRPEDRPWLLTERAVEVRQVNPVPIVDPPKVPPV